METSKISDALEAILFVYGEPMKIRKAAELLGVSEEEVESAAQALKEKNEASGGILLIVSESGLQLATKPEFSELVQKIAKEEMDSELSPASLETLAIIAYLGPASRAEIEFIRGVNSSFILRNLSIRGLIERKSDPRRPSTFTYQSSLDFLKHIGLDTPEKLPEYEKYRGLLKSLREENKQEEVRAEGSSSN